MGVESTPTSTMRRLLEPDHRAARRAHQRNAVAPVEDAAGGEMGVLLGYMSQRVLGQYDLLVSEEHDMGDFVDDVGPNVLSLEKKRTFSCRARATSACWTPGLPRAHASGTQLTAVPWMSST